MQAFVRKSLRFGATAADASAFVLSTAAGKLRQVAGEETSVPGEAPAPDPVPVPVVRGDERDDGPHETHGETPAPGTRTYANVGDPKAAKKLRQRGAQRAGG